MIRLCPWNGLEFAQPPHAHHKLHYKLIEIAAKWGFSDRYQIACASRITSQHVKDMKPLPSGMLMLPQLAYKR